MSARVTRADQLVRVPWKNGGGTTAEIAAFPEGSDFDTFGWRISMADVEADGAFSSFPGIDRTLVVLEGDGLDLEVNGEIYRLDKRSPTLSFSGDDQAIGRLRSSPIRDLNVMTRRGRFEHRTRIMQPGVTLLSADTCAAFMVPLDSALDITWRGALHSLGCFDTLHLDPTQDLIQVAGGGRSILVEIGHASSSS
jgi:environmental stress-induced protein Ves